MTVKFVETAHETMAIQQDDVYEMVETTAYFEAYRHVLTALQETYQEDLPFEVGKHYELHLGVFLWLIPFCRCLFSYRCTDDVTAW